MCEGSEKKCCGDPQVKAVRDAAVALANAGVDLQNEGGIKGVAGDKVVCLAEQAAKAVGEELEDVEEEVAADPPAVVEGAGGGEQAEGGGGAKQA